MRRPLSEIIATLNERFGTAFTEEDRLFFQQIKEKACKSEQIVRTAMANPLDKFELGIRKLIEDLMIERMGENDKIVTRYMADQEFQGSAFPPTLPQRTQDGTFRPYLPRVPERLPLSASGEPTAENGCPTAYWGGRFAGRGQRSA